ncbi:hypothetical protein QCA50_001800 [Cerrena zonata]|uniref:Uncharacterized protein n=1 Tax=Cerrena zonata TaxID=2478898 RepID=A0AAW0GMQ4_9APHY
MFRLTRPLFSQVLKTTTGITGLKVHPNPLPELKKTYQSTLTALSTIPETSVYRQGVEALTQHKLKIVEGANGDIQAVEKQLDEGQIEESINIAQDELNLVSKMAEWKAYVYLCFNTLVTSNPLNLHSQVGTAGREARTWSMGILWQSC